MDRASSSMEKEKAFSLKSNALANGLRILNRAFYYWPAITVSAAFILFWQIGADTGIISRVSFSSPLEISRVFFSLGKTGEIWGHLTISLYRALGGFAIGSFLGLIMGLLTGSFPICRRIFEPILTFLYGFPKVALIPLMIILLGTGDTMRMTLIAIISFFPMWFNAESGVREMDSFLILVAQNFGANQGQIITKVAIPYIIPYVIAGLKLSAGLALHLIVIAEMVAAEKGIGYLIWFSGATANVSQLFMGIIVLVILSAAILGLFNIAERKLAPWRTEIEKN